MAKKVKKAKKVVEEQAELSLLDMARHEQKMPREIFAKPDGSGRKHTHEAFRIWCVLPDVFKGMPERITELLGITDPITLELLAIKNNAQFAETFGCGTHTLSRWRKEVEGGDDYAENVRKVFKPLTRNLVASLYRKAIEEGDAARFKIYMQVIEGWREQLGLEHSGEVELGLTPEERGAVDRLIEKNTVKSP